MNVFILTDYDRQGEFYSPWDRRVSDKIYPEMTVYDLEQQLLKEVFGIEDFQFGYRLIITYNGNILSNEKTVRECRITEGGTIHIVFTRTPFSHEPVMVVALIEKSPEKIRESSVHELQEEKRLLTVQGTLREIWCSSNSRTKSFVVVDNDVYARRVIEAFHQDFSREVAFDAEGVNLSRTGKMTVISLSLCQPLSIAFIFDLISIGPSIFAGANSLKELLESRVIKKITFDCRNDSNALYHQYGVSLKNCLDLQVFQLGIKIRNKSHCVFSTENYPYVRGLRYIAGGYLPNSEINDLGGIVPHREDEEIWGKRPLLDIQWQYAANDVHLINRLLRGMRNLRLPLNLHERIDKGSERYTEVFRNTDVDYQSDFQRYRDVIMGIVNI